MPVVNVYSTSVTTENISRFELLAWVNDCLQSNLTKIEEMSTAAAYCQLTDFLFPSRVPLRKVKWNSRSEVDWINNWGVLQRAWKEIGIDKPVPVQSLMRAKFQDNFEFLQWFKKFFDANYDGHPYDPLAARNFEEFPATLPGGAKRAPAPAGGAGSKRVAAGGTVTPTAQPSATRGRLSQGKPAVAVTTTARAPSTTGSASSRPKTTTSAFAKPPSPSGRMSLGRAPPTKQQNGTTAQAPGMVAEMTLLKQKNSELNAQLAETREQAALYERERNFYYDKLRRVEILCGGCAQPDGKLSVGEVQGILWDTAESNNAPNDAPSPQPQGDAIPSPGDVAPRLDSPSEQELHQLVQSGVANNSGMDMAHLDDSFLMADPSVAPSGNENTILDDVTSPQAFQQPPEQTHTATAQQSARGNNDTFNAHESETRPADAANMTHPVIGAVLNNTHPVDDPSILHYVGADVSLATYLGKTDELNNILDLSASPVPQKGLNDTYTADELAEVRNVTLPVIDSALNNTQTLVQQEQAANTAQENGTAAAEL